MTGRIITGSSINDCFVFLNQTQPIWAKSMDTPRMPSPSEGTASNKLLGHCVWQLSIPLPRIVTVPLGSGEMRPCRLPETFLERNTPVSVQYDLTIIVSRGMLRSDNRSVTLHFTLDISFFSFCCISMHSPFHQDQDCFWIHSELKAGCSFHSPAAGLSTVLAYTKSSHRSRWLEMSEACHCSRHRA